MALTPEQFEALKASLAQKRALQQQSVASQPQTVAEPEGNVFSKFGRGFAKGAATTFGNLGAFSEELAEHTTGRVVSAALGKGFTKFEAPNSAYDTDTSERARATHARLVPQGNAENVGFFTERIAEFLLPTNPVVKAQRGLTGLVKGSGLIAGTARTAIRAGVEGAAGAGIATAQEGEFNDAAKTAAIVSAMFPAVGALLRGTKQGIGKSLVATGQKIQTTKIRPLDADMKDGFKIENVAKYDLGGSLEQTLAKTNIKINELAGQLRQRLADATTPVNLDEVYDRTAARLLQDRAVTFGNNAGIRRVLEGIKSEIDDVTPDGFVDLLQANTVKRGAGTKGAWAYNRPEPDASAIETVYTTFYNELKTAIEEAAKRSGHGDIAAINRQLSELIPISNAVIRRLPVEARNNAISLTDSIALVGAVFDPQALAVLGATRLSRSGRFGNVLVRAGQKLQSGAPRTLLGERFFGSVPKALGAATPKTALRAPRDQAFAGVVGGVEYEDGDVSFNPAAAALGVAGMAGAKKWAGTKSSNASTGTNTSTGSAPTGKEAVYGRKTDTSAPFDGNVSSLKKLGSGSDRDVYQLTNNRVIKKAKNAEGRFQNRVLADDTFAQQNGLIPRVYERGDDYIITDRVAPPDARTKEMVAKIKELDLRRRVATPGGTDAYEAKLHKAINILNEYGYNGNALLRYEDNISWGDFEELANWGTLNGRPIHIDEGTFDSVMLMATANTRAQRLSKNPTSTQPPIPKELEPLAAEARKYKSAEEFVSSKNVLYHYSDRSLSGSTLKPGTTEELAEMNYFGDGVYLTNQRYGYPGQHEAYAVVPKDLKILDLTSEKAADRFLQQVSKKTGIPVAHSGGGLYDDLRLMASNAGENHAAIKKAVDELVKGYDAIKAPFVKYTDADDNWELVIRNKEVPFVDDAKLIDFYNRVTKKR